MNAFTAPSIVWFRQDLRLLDQPALGAAVLRGAPVIPLYIWAPEEDGDWPPGAASRWWLHHSLASLDQSLRARGSRLILRRGPSLAAIRQIAAATGASHLYFNRLYEPAARERDRRLQENLEGLGLAVTAFNGSLLTDPEAVRTGKDGPFQVFTPFWRACQRAGDPPQPAAAPRSLPSPPLWPETITLDSLGLRPAPDWAAGLREAWQPGEAGARALLDRFLDEAAAGYAEGRDRPDLPGTSRLSPHLHFGEISPRHVWHAARERAALDPRKGVARGIDAWLRQLYWREFAYHILHHFPHTTSQPLREAFARFPWSRAPKALAAWQRGRTGYPAVDAAMRELWRTGWMHSRMRMVAASFLTKDLRIHWLEGARWFWDTLVDADLANNTFGWQWTAGCGADAAPYFRIFNPVGQGRRFDPQGAYVRHWIPELAALPARWLHEPWAAGQATLDASNVELGKTYPRPIVDHAGARLLALESYGRNHER